MSQYSITALEKLTGVKAHTLRVWEKRYGIIEPKRDMNNMRCYEEADLQYLMKINQLRSQGIKISTIANFSTKEFETRYLESLNLGVSGCCILDRLTIAVEKTQESKLYLILKDRLTVLGIHQFVSNIWQPMQQRLGVLAISGGLHKIHLRLFDQVIEHLLESENIDRMLHDEICNGSALLINTCGSASSIFHQMTKRLLIENHIDVVSFTLCQGEWESLTSIFEKRTFHQIFIHYKATASDGHPVYEKISTVLPDNVQVLIYGSDLTDHNLPPNWNNIEFSKLLNYISSSTFYNKMEVASFEGRI